MPHTAEAPSRRAIASWCLYDWANSSYNTIITTFIFSVYFARGVVGDEVAKATDGVIFDGVVRTIPQAVGVQTILERLDRQMDHVLFFDVKDEELLARLEKRRGVEHRADDDPAAVAVRLKAYREQTAPVLGWYRDRGLVHTVDAVGTVEQVADRVKKILGR